MSTHRHTSGFCHGLLKKIRAQGWVWTASSTVEQNAWVPVCLDRVITGPQGGFGSQFTDPATPWPREALYTKCVIFHPRKSVSSGLVTELHLDKEGCSRALSSNPDLYHHAVLHTQPNPSFFINTGQLRSEGQRWGRAFASVSAV